MPPKTGKGVYKAMIRQTTTLQLHNAIKNKLLNLVKAEIYNKSTRKTEEISNDKFLEYFDFFCESGIFVDSIGWHFERNYKNGIYEVETGKTNGNSEVIITAFFRQNDGTDMEELERTLNMAEEE